MLQQKLGRSCSFMNEGQLNSTNSGSHSYYAQESNDNASTTEGQHSEDIQPMTFSDDPQIGNLQNLPCSVFQPEQCQTHTLSSTKNTASFTEDNSSDEYSPFVKDPFSILTHEVDIYHPIYQQPQQQQQQQYLNQSSFHNNNGNMMNDTYGYHKNGEQSYFENRIFDFNNQQQQNINQNYQILPLDNQERVEFFNDQSIYQDNQFQNDQQNNVQFIQSHEQSQQLQQIQQQQQQQSFFQQQELYQFQIQEQQQFFQQQQDDFLFPQQQYGFQTEEQQYQQQLSQQQQQQQQYEQLQFLQQQEEQIQQSQQNDEQQQQNEQQQFQYIQSNCQHQNLPPPPPYSEYELAMLNQQRIYHEQIATNLQIQQLQNYNQEINQNINSEQSTNNSEQDENQVQQKQKKQYQSKRKNQQQSSSSLKTDEQQQQEQSESPSLKQNKLQKKQYIPKIKEEKQKKIKKVKIAKEEIIVQFRRQITTRKVENKIIEVNVTPKEEYKRLQLKNNIKNFLAKGLKHLLKKLNSSLNINEEDKPFFRTIIESYKNAIGKTDMYLLINKFEYLSQQEYNSFENFINYQQFQNQEKLVKENNSFKDFFLIQKKMKSLNIHMNFQNYITFLEKLNELNTFNRIQFNHYLLHEYDPIILKIKADKQDQLYFKQYLLLALTKPSVLI